MFFSRSIAPLVIFAGLAYATSSGLATRNECPASQDVTMVYMQTFVFVYPIVIDQYCPATTVLTLDGTATVNVTNAPTHLSTTVFITGTSSLVATISGSVASSYAAVSSAFSQQASSIISSYTSSPSTISAPLFSTLYSNPGSTRLYANSTVVPANTGLLLNSTAAVNTTTALSCLSATTTSYTITQTPSAITTFVTKLNNVTAYTAQTVYTTLVFYTTLTDVSSTTTTTLTTDISSQVIQLTVPYTSTTIVPETSVVSTETQVSTVLSTSTVVSIVPRFQATSAAYCSNASISSITVTEFAPTPTHTITQIQNFTTSISNISSISASTTLVDSTTQYLTAIVTETISSTSTVFDYNTVTIPYTTTSVSLETSTTTATSISIVETAAPQFYLQVGPGVTRAGQYAYFFAQNTPTAGVLKTSSTKSSTGLCSLNSNGNLVCDNFIAWLGSSSDSRIVDLTHLATAESSDAIKLVCSLNDDSELTCAAINGKSVFQLCYGPDSAILYTASSYSADSCQVITLNAVSV